MSEQNPDKELSLDELKDVSGGGMSLDRLGTQKGKKKKSNGTSLVDMETGTVYFEDRLDDSYDSGDIHEPTPMDAISVNTSERQ